jgi:hypothetical protein
VMHRCRRDLPLRLGGRLRAGQDGAYGPLRDPPDRGLQRSDAAHVRERGGGIRVLTSRPRCVHPAN